MKRKLIIKHNKYYVLFRYGEGPGGKDVFSIVFERNKERAFFKAVEKYGSYAVFDVITAKKYNVHAISKMSHFKLFETIGSSTVEI